MTDEEVKNELDKLTINNSFKKIFKKDYKSFIRRSFSDLFIYFRQKKVTELQLLRVLHNANYGFGICTEINKVVVFKNAVKKVNSLWAINNAYWVDSEICYAHRVKDKYTVNYLNNLFNKI